MFLSRTLTYVQTGLSYDNVMENDMASAAVKRLTDDEVVELLSRYDWMIRWIARRAMGQYANADDMDDCVAEVQLQFFRAAQRFDASRGIKFSTYVYRLANIYAQKWKANVRARGMRLPATLRGTTVKMRSLMPTDDRDEYTLATKGPEIRDDLTSLWSQLRSILTDRQIAILRHYFVDGKNCRKIGKRYGCTRDNISLVIRTALARIKRSAPHLASYIH